MKNFLTFPGLLILTACANIAMPTGGPRDKTPPELISSSPYKNQLNFNGKSIELVFNEDIKLKDPKEEILIVPSIGKKTLFTVKKKKLIISPELEWLPNTTYSINFRDGVQDITEGNPAENLHLAFSTGPIIDSLYINGMVNDIFTEQIPLKITIALYESDTFDIFKHTPTFFTKSDKNGKFSLPNLKAQQYFIYAFDDKNKNLKVDSKTEKFGFRTFTINPLSQKDSIQIPMTSVDSRPLTITNIRHTDKTSRLRFNKPIDSLSIQGISSRESFYTFGNDQSELIFYNAFTKGDSIKTTLNATDSVGNKIDTVFFIKHGEIKTAEESFKIKELPQQYDLATRLFTYTISYNKPIGKINTDSILVKYDTIKNVPVEIKNIKIDTLHNQLIIKTPIEELQDEEKKKTAQAQFLLGKGALITMVNDSSKRTMRQIKVSKEDDLGTVAVKIETNVPNYIVQVMTNDNTIVQSHTNIKNYTFKNLEPMEYRLRIIIDENKNGKWDAGNFYKMSEPERIILFKSEEGKYSFPLRANWEYGPVLIKF